MIAASIFDHPIILILIAAVALIRWLVEKAKASSQNTQAPPPPSQPISRGGETQTEEERIRRFMEALGQPPGTRPPPKVPQRRRSVIPQVFPKLPTLTTAPPPLPEEPAPVAVPPPLPFEVAAPRLAVPRQSGFEVQDFARQTSSEPPREARRQSLLRVKLGTPQDLRTAIVLREIFGPPRSLQPADLISGF